MATGFRREGTSRWPTKRQLPLLYRSGGVPEGLGDVLRFEIRVLIEDLLNRHPVGNHRDNCGNRKAKVAYARHTSHSLRIYGDAIERHEIQATASLQAGFAAGVQNSLGTALGWSRPVAATAYPHSAVTSGRAGL